MGKTRVRGHTRVSSAGKIHRVRAHQRTVTWKDLLGAARDQMRARGPIGAAAVGSAALMALTYLFYGVFSFLAAVMLAVGLVSFGFIAWAVGVKARKNKPARQSRWSGILSPRRRIRAWWYSKKRAWIRRMLPSFIYKNIHRRRV